jgi:hypothetical protein
MKLKVKLTPYQSALIDFKLRQAKAKKLGIDITKLPMIEEIKKAIIDYSKKKSNSKKQ